jgi:hypothetical protein
MFSRNAKTVVDGEEVTDLLTRFKTSDDYTAPAPEPDRAPEPDPVPPNEPAAPSNGSGEPSKRDLAAQARLDSHAAVPTRGPGAPSGPPDDFEAAFDYYDQKGAA